LHRARHVGHTRHCLAHHLLHLGQIILLSLKRVRHGHLSLSIQLPCELVEAVIEVVGLVFTGSSPYLLLVGEIGVNVY
jgi:hypothetical protein